MDKKRIWGIAVLLAATAAGLCMAQREPGGGAVPVPVPEAAREARLVLRDCFSRQYSEAACSTIYADLTHDGTEELLVLELEDGPAQLHADTLSPTDFRSGTVTVLKAEENGSASAIYTFSCGADPAERGGLYLTKWEEQPCLLLCCPDREPVCFSLEEDGTPREYPTEAGSSEQAKPLLVYGGQPFAYLDELFTTY